ncbi:MAG: hypothetical protein AAGG47_06605 [Pseudomonadota bacterium]
MPGTFVTGFEPFGNWPINSSWQAVVALAAMRPNIATACLPVDHAAAADAVRSLIAHHRPSVLLLTGLAPGAGFRIETVARPGPLVPWAGGTRCARWPITEALTAVRKHGLPIRRSADAGRYVCDTTFWAALGSSVPEVGFLHVPPPAPQWPPRRLARALDAVLSVADGAARGA